MKKYFKFLAIFSVLMLICVGNVNAETLHVSTESELRDAINNAACDEVILDANITLESQLDISDKNLTIDLNSHNISRTAQVLRFSGTGDVTVKDGSIGGAVGYYNTVTISKSADDLVFDNVDIYNSSTNARGVISMVSSGGDVYLQNGTKARTSYNTPDGDAIHLQKEDSTAVLHLNQAILIGSSSYGVICGPQSSTIAIDFVDGVIVSANLDSGSLISYNKPLKDYFANAQSVNLNGSMISKDDIGSYMNGTTLQFGPTARFKEITKSEMSHGSVKTNGGTGTSYAMVGYPVIIKGAPDHGYETTSITVKDANNNNIQISSDKFGMPNSNVTVSAVFTEKDYNQITFGTDANGTIEGDTISAREGDRIYVSIIPNTGYAFKNAVIKDANNKTIEYQVTSGSGLEISQITFIMSDSAVTVTPEFAKIINITTNVTNEEYGNVTRPATQALPGDLLKVEAVPYSGNGIEEFTIVDALGNPIALNDAHKFEVPNSDVTITIKFKKIATVVVSGVPSDKGAIHIADAGTNEFGYSMYAVSYTEAQGYRFVSWNVYDEDGPIEVIDGIFTAREKNVTVDANWEAAETFTISYTPLENGSLEVVSSAYAGKVITIKVNPAKYYHLGELHVYKNFNHEEVTVTDLKFTMPAENVTIEYTMIEGIRVSTENELRNAINNEEELIIISSDITLSDGLSISGSDITIEFDNHKITRNGQILSISGTSNITLRNGTLDTSAYSINGNTLAVNTTDGKVILDNMQVYSKYNTAMSVSSSAGDIYIMNGSIIEVKEPNNSGGDALHLQNSSSTATVHINYATLIGSAGYGVIGGPASSTIDVDFILGTLRTANGQNGALFSYNRSSEPYFNGKTIYVDGQVPTDFGTTSLNGTIAQFGSASKFDTVTISSSIVNGTVTTKQAHALKGDKVYITVTPAEGYDLERLYDQNGDDIRTSNYEWFVMPQGPITIYATFTNSKYTLTLDQSGQTTFGTVSFGGSRFAEGETVSYSVNTPAGYKLNRFIIENSDGVDVTSSITIDYTNKTIVMPGYNIVVKPRYVLYTFNIICTKTSGYGTCGAAQNVVPGANINLVLSPAAGYKINNVLIEDANGNDISSIVNYNATNYSFKMPEYDVYVKVQFTPLTYNITAVTDWHGTLTVSATKATTGSSITVKAKSIYGYKIVRIRVLKTDGTVVQNIDLNGTDVAASFKMYGHDVKVQVMYSLKTMTDVPELKIKSSTYNSVNLNWEKINDSTGYKVYRSTDNKKWTVVKTITSKDTISFNNTSLKTGTKYYYKILPVKGSTNGKYSNVVAITPVTEATKLTGYKSYYGYAQLSWTKVTGASGYYVYRSTSQNGSYSKIATTTKLKYSDKKAANGKTYYYKVVSYRTVSGKKKAGKTSNIVQAQRLNETISYTVTPGSLKNTLKITKNNGAVKYEIYRATSKSGKYKKVAILTASNYSGNTIEWVNTGLTKGKTYWYKIRAVNANTSKYSAKKSGKVTA